MNLVYIYLIMFIGAVYLLLLPTVKNEYKRSKAIAFVIVMVLIFLSAFKANSVGYDSQNYINIFNLIGHNSFKSVMFTDLFRYEKGFVLYTWLMYHICSKHLIYFLVSYICIYFLVYKWAVDNSDQPGLTVFVVLCVFFPFMLTGLRQAMAMAIIICSFTYYKKRKWIKCLLIIFAAFLFHASSIIIVFIYIFALINKFWLKNALVLLAAAFVWFRRVLVFNFANSFMSQYEKFQIENGSKPYLYIAMLAIVYIAALFLRKQIVNDYSKNDDERQVKKELDLIIAIFSAGFVLIPLAFLNGTLLRLVMYSSIFIALLIPKICYTLFNTYKLYIVKPFIIVSFVYVFWHMVLYSSVYAYQFP